MNMHETTALLSGPGSAGVAIAVGLGSAAAFATSNALQHRAAGTVPSTVHHALAVLGHLARQPSWIVATCISFVALLLHAVALRIGSIALVQPLMLAGVILAVPMRSALERKLPRWCEIRAVSVTLAGLLVFILSAKPQPSHALPSVVEAGAFVLVCFAVGACALRASHRWCVGAPGREAAILGAGAGVMFGATAGLLKMLGTTAGSGRHQLPLLMAICALLVAAGLLGTAMNQRAYQLAPIAFSMPLVNVVDIIVAVMFGATVLGELPGHSASLIATQVTALVFVGIGLRFISALQTDTSQGETSGPAVASSVVAPTRAPAPVLAGQLG